MACAQKEKSRAGSSGEWIGQSCSVFREIILSPNLEARNWRHRYVTWHLASFCWHYYWRLVAIKPSFDDTQHSDRHHLHQVFITQSWGSLEPHPPFPSSLLHSTISWRLSGASICLSDFVIVVKQTISRQIIWLSGTNLLLMSAHNYRQRGWHKVGICTRGGASA